MKLSLIYWTSTESIFILHTAPACVTSYSHSDTASAAESERVFSMPAMMKDYRLVHRPMD
jgi:hypothetical protein